MKKLKSFFTKLPIALKALFSSESYIAVANKKGIVRYCGRLKIKQVEMISDDLVDIIETVIEQEAALQTVKDIVNKPI